jgi:hypothetical protein
LTSIIGSGFANSSISSILSFLFSTYSASISGTGFYSSSSTSGNLGVSNVSLSSLSAGSTYVVSVGRSNFILEMGGEISSLVELHSLTHLGGDSSMRFASGEPSNAS